MTKFSRTFAILASSLIALVTLCQPAQATQISAVVPAEERRALMELYAATQGAQWKNATGWGNTADVCNWHGIFCDFLDGNPQRPVVNGLSLEDNNLRGTLPASLSQLQHLRRLDVSRNALTGDVPEGLLQRFDQHEMEFYGGGNSFSNMVVHAALEVTAVGALCSGVDDLRYRAEFTDAGQTRLQSIRCASADSDSRDTYCLVKEGYILSLARLSRALAKLGFARFEPEYSYKFNFFTTHGIYVTTTARWGNGTTKTVESYQAQGPLDVWMAQQVFLSLMQDGGWIRESRQSTCDFEK
jgi:hypothetical protein